MQMWHGIQQLAKEISVAVPGPSKVKAHSPNERLAYGSSVDIDRVPAIIGSRRGSIAHAGPSYTVGKTLSTLDSSYEYDVSAGYRNPLGPRM